MNRLMLLVIITLAGIGCGRPPAHEVRVHGDGLVRFRILAPQARQVSLLTSQDGFLPHAAVGREGGVWEVIYPAQNGARYFYLVDGMAFVPDCSRREKDDFDSVNCIYQPGP